MTIDEDQTAKENMRCSTIWMQYGWLNRRNEQSEDNGMLACRESFKELILINDLFNEFFENDALRQLSRDVIGY